MNFADGSTDNKITINIGRHFEIFGQDGHILFRVSARMGLVAGLEEIRLAQLRQKCFCISYLPSKQVIRIILSASYKPKSRPLFPFQLFMADPLQKPYVNIRMSALCEPRDCLLWRNHKSSHCKG